MGETIAFSICNKPFKPLSIPSGRVKSRKGFPRMRSTNNYWHYIIKGQSPSHKHMVHTSLANLTC
jgi:hypothetical protein